MISLARIRDEFFGIRGELDAVFRTRLAYDG